MLPTIDVIFFHPVKKFSVLYRGGKLWQLPRLDFNAQSLAYAKPYTGNPEELFIAANQQPSDTALNTELLSLDLPATLVGRNVPQFEHWWQANRYHYRDMIRQKADAQARAKSVPHNGVDPQPHVMPNSVHLTSQNLPQTTASDAQITTNQSDTIFDELLAELIRDL